MAIDLDKIRAMHDKLSNPSTGGSSDFTAMPRVQFVLLALEGAHKRRNSS